MARSRCGALSSCARLCDALHEAQLHVSVMHSFIPLIHLIENSKCHMLEINQCVQFYLRHCYLFLCQKSQVDIVHFEATARSLPASASIKESSSRVDVTAKPSEPLPF